MKEKKIQEGNIAYYSFQDNNLKNAIGWIKKIIDENKNKVVKNIDLKFKIVYLDGKEDSNEN